MKKFIKVLSVSLLAAMLLTSCNSGGSTDDSTTTTTTTTTTEEVKLVSPLVNYNENAEITVEYKGQSETGNGSVELAVSAAYTLGQKIKITVPAEQHFIAVTIAKGVLDESYVYIENGSFEYKIPNFDRAYPSELKTKGSTISARIPTLEELTKTHNLALNTCDLVTSTKFFPHATTTNVYNNDAEWQARNVIDGFTQNTGHGTYPLQSWGPKENLSRNDSITIDFGHDVLVSEIVISIRADFPHDGYWDTCRVYFSDGTYQELSIKGTAKAQKFTIAVDGEAKATSYVKFKNFEKADDSQGVWCAWMEVNVNGTEIAPN